MPFRSRDCSQDQALIDQFPVGSRVWRTSGCSTQGTIERVVESGYLNQGPVAYVCWSLPVRPNRLRGEMRNWILLRKLSLLQPIDEEE